MAKKKIRCYIRGLDYMNDDPSAVDVLYGKCEFDDEATASV